MTRETHSGDAEWERLVSEGRDPAWRIAWEDHLSPKERRSVRTTVKARLPASEENLRRYAAGYARRLLRWNRRMTRLIPINVGVVGLWIYLACFTGSSESLPCWLWVIAGVLWLTLLPVWLVIQRRKLLRAVEANSPSNRSTS